LDGGEAREEQRDRLCQPRPDRGRGGGADEPCGRSPIATQKAQLPRRGNGGGLGRIRPFRDGLDEVANAGALAVVQPGGSVKDDEVIDAPDGHGIAMVFTEVRHFRR